MLLYVARGIGLWSMLAPENLSYKKTPTTKNEHLKQQTSRTMKHATAFAVAKVAVAAAATGGGATGGGAQRLVAAEQKLQPQHTLFNDRRLQEDASVINTISIGGTAFFDVNGNGRRDPEHGDGDINPISNTTISVMTELWSCDTGLNIGYQLTDASGKYLFTVPAEEGEACYYVRYDSSSMEGTFSCSGQPKCATDNLIMSAGEEALDIDVGIRGSDFDELAAKITVDEQQETQGDTADIVDDDGWSVVSGGMVFEPLSYFPTFVLPSRPSPSVATSPPTTAPSTSVVTSPPTEKNMSPVPTNSSSATNPAGVFDGTEQQANQGVPSSGLIQLNSQIRVMLSNIESLMEDSSEKLFNDVCDTFLNEQLAIAVPPISYVRCEVVNQSVLSEGRKNLRNLERVARSLGSTLAAEVNVTGVALPTSTIKTKEQVKFEDKLVSAFTAQGDEFVRLLKKEEAKVVTNFNDATFPTLDKVWAVKITDETEGDAKTSNQNGDSSSIPIAAIAAIAAGGGVLLVLGILLVVRSRRNKRKQQQDLKIDFSKETISSPTSPNNSVGYYSTPVLSNSGVEVDRRAVSPTDMSSRVQRDVMAPPGKLRILIANTQGYGPAIHTIKPNSPVEGLLFVGDIIVAVNDTSTRKSKADEITRLLKVTVREERKITVLSLRR